MTDILLGFVGDVLVDRDVPSEAFSSARGAIDSVDVLFGNLEAAYSDSPAPPLGAGALALPRIHNLAAISEAGFDVVSMANNHIVDAGLDAMLDTRARLRSQGVSTCGVGTNLIDARKPAIVKSNGVTVAYLAYASMFPCGYEAKSNRPGLAPVRGYNFLSRVLRRSLSTRHDSVRDDRPGRDRLR